MGHKGQKEAQDPILVLRRQRDDRKAEIAHVEARRAEIAARQVSDKDKKARFLARLDEQLKQLRDSLATVEKLIELDEEGRSL